MLRLLLLYIGMLSLSVSAMQPQHVVYPGTAERDDYALAVLKLALSYHPEKHYLAVPFGTDMPKPQTMLKLEHNDGIDVLFGSATKERVERFQAVHFPIMRGMYGLRLALINAENPNLLANATARELRNLTATQFHAWTDTKILQANHFDVFASSGYDNMYEMLARGRVHYFPRAAIEIEHDLGQHQGLPIVIDQHILLAYPAAYYIYVNKANDTLANDILTGLERALSDGRFAALFAEYFASTIERLNIDNRRVIHLHNPFLPDGVPIQRKELWFNPGETAAATQH